MLGSYSDHRAVFVEVTKTEHGHGGSGWEFGNCLWSPSRNKAGHDLYHLMREAKAGDLVLHILEDWEPVGGREHRFVGRSFVQSEHESRNDEPPMPGDWAGQAPYYRIALRDYAAFPEAISLTALYGLYEDELRSELATKPALYPFILYDSGRTIQLRQGGYINVCTPALFDLVRQAIGEGPPPPGAPPTPPGAPTPSADREYRETKRLAGERYAFARNPGLVRAARAIRGYQCEACDFDFQATYGELGTKYIECHHVDPLADRDQPTATTTVTDVRMLCANCHRMVHRRRPAVLVEDLRATLGLPPKAPIAELDR